MKYTEGPSEVAIAAGLCIIYMYPEWQRRWWRISVHSCRSTSVASPAAAASDVSGCFSDFKMAPQIRSKESDTPGTSNTTSSRTSEFRRCGSASHLLVLRPDWFSSGSNWNGETERISTHKIAASSLCGITGAQLSTLSIVRALQKTRTCTRFTVTRHKDWRLISRRGLQTSCKTFPSSV